MSLIDTFSLHGRDILITGATGYLGKAMSRVLAEAGARILVNSRSHEACQQLVSELTEAGYLADSAAFDLNDHSATAKFFKIRNEKPIHCVINNAYSGGAGTIETSGCDDYRKSYEMSVVAAHNIFRLALPALRKAVRDTGDASVINVSSMYASVSPDLGAYDHAEVANPPFYGAAKAALLQWTRYAACEFGKENIRVNAVSPGPFPSTAVQKSSPAFVNRLAAKVPMGRIGQSHEIGGVILMLASPASTFINGANIPVDGGWTSW
ncbi:MAG: SDR family oxidoreductase [Sphingomonadaceae bacterium]